jgi:hypothetical protein
MRRARWSISAALRWIGWMTGRDVMRTVYAILSTIPVV